MGNLASIPLGWVIVSAAVVAAGATFSVGANDAANALGTSVGARSLSLRSAIVLGACMEFLGIVALGAVVGSTLRNGIIDPAAFPDPRYFVIGMFSVLCASFAWLLAATLLGLPVSTTHTIVAGIAAFGLFEVGVAALQVQSVVIIAVSWVVSPVSGFVAALLLYLLLEWALVRRHVAREDAAGLRRWADWLFPLCTAATLGFMTVTVLLAVQKSAGGVPLAVLIVVPLAVAAAAGAAVWLLLLPLWHAHHQTWGPRAARVLHWGEPPEPPRAAEEEAAAATSSSASTQDEEVSQDREAGEKKLIVASTPRQLAEATHEAQRLFVSLMVVTAAIVAFSHAANDISNSVAPFLVCLEWVTTQSVDPAFRGPFWLYVLAGVFLVLGLVCLGFMVMRTIGEKVTKLNPLAGFVAQLSASAVIVICTVFGMPISTTHCIVGAVFGISVASRQPVQWRVLGRILLGWLVTIAVGAGLTLAFYAPLRLTIAPNATLVNATV